MRETQDFVYKVRKVLLFGSMLTDKAMVGDVDVAVEIVAKHPDDANLTDTLMGQARQAELEGRQFKSVFEKLCCSQSRVMVFLKARSRVLQLHPHNDAVLNLCESKVIFDDDDEFAQKCHSPKSSSELLISEDSVMPRVIVAAQKHAIHAGLLICSGQSVINAGSQDLGRTKRVLPFWTEVFPINRI